MDNDDQEPLHGIVDRDKKEIVSFRELWESLMSNTDTGVEVPEYVNTWNKLDYQTKLDVAKYIGKIIVDHATEGGSYRYLIYERLGFDVDAYGYLLDDYMTISNQFIIEEPMEPSELEKKFNDLCDKIPVYLSTEDKEKWNINSDRSLAFELYFKFCALNKTVTDQKETINRLKDEIKRYEK